MWKLIGISVGVLIGLIVLSVAMMYVSGTISILTAPFRGHVATVEETTANPNFRISAYNSFFDKCASVVAMEQRINLLESKPNLTDKEQTELRGMKGIHADLVSRYNNDVRKDYTVGQMRDSDLPYQLNINGGNTCGY